MDYFTPQGEFRVDAAGSPILLNCLMYKLSYFRFGELQVGGPVYITLVYSISELFISMSWGSHPTQLTVQDLWDNPTAVANFLN